MDGGDHLPDRHAETSGISRVRTGGYSEAEGGVASGANRSHLRLIGIRRRVVPTGRLQDDV